MHHRPTPTSLVLLVLLSFAVSVGGCNDSGRQHRETPVSLAITGARVWTGNPEQPWAEAVAVAGDRIALVGSDDDVAALLGPDTLRIDAAGGMLVPGFIDTHVHFAIGGSSLASVQLRDAMTPEEFVTRIAAHAETLEPGEWITDGAWDHENWGGELPSREWIDRITPDNPVWIYRLDGHMALANSLALEQAGVSAETQDIDGGEIVRDPAGEPTGVLKDNAMSLVNAVVPPPGDELLDRQILAAMRHVAGNGVTTVHDMADFDSMASYRRLRDSGDMLTRVYSIVPLDQWARLESEVSAHGTGDDWLRIGGLKGFMDGSLGSHTAAFFEPFSDAPNDRGMLINDLADMRNWIEAADAAGLHVMVHAIGDRAIAKLLDIYGRVAEVNGPRDRRFRVEHAQHIRASDIPRFSQNDIVASMQPYHAIDDGRWADRVIGAERAQTTYAFNSLLESGARVAFGSDWFVAPADPIAGIYAAVTRRTLDGAHPGGWVPAEKITVEEALRAYTATGAFASFEEAQKGTIEAGKLADLVLLDRDLTRIPPESIRDTEILRTFVGGRQVFPVIAADN